MGSIGKIELGTDAATNEETYFALSASPDETLTGATTNAAVDVGSCQPANHANLWDYNDNLVSRVSKPDDCFRITVDHGLERNYLDAYTVELDPIGGDVIGSWGNIPWPQWKELTCEPKMFTASEELEVGICELFEAEVDRLPTPHAIPVVQNHEATGAANVSAPTLAGFNLLYVEDPDDPWRPGPRPTGITSPRCGTNGRGRTMRGSATRCLLRTCTTASIRTNGSQRDGWHGRSRYYRHSQRPPDAEPGFG